MDIKIFKTKVKVINIYKIAICDDDEKYLHKISECVSDYIKYFNAPGLVCHTYSCTNDLLEKISTSESYDIYILDIYIDELSGMELAKRIRAVNKDAAIFFLTSSRAHATGAFLVEAVHYLVKPLDRRELFSALDRCMERLSVVKEKAFLLLKSTEGAQKVYHDEIIYIEAVKQYQKVVLKSGRITVRESMQGLYEMLKDNNAFIMPHRAFIVNMQHIRKISTAEITMRDGSRVPLPRGEYKKVKQQFMDFCFSDRPDYVEV